MSRIEIEPYNSVRHPNPMRWFDDSQRKRHLRAPNLIPYNVCLVTVKDFTFIFHSVEQIQICLDYYRREIHPSSRISIGAADHWEMQRRYERLPQRLLESRTRLEVVATLEKAMVEYSQVPGAVTHVEVKPYEDTS